MITQNVISRSVFGNKRVVTGLFADNDASGNAGVGGDIVTGLSTVEFINLTQKGSVVDPSGNTHIVVNETFPTVTGDITAIYDHAVTLLYMAIGR